MRRTTNTMDTRPDPNAVSEEELHALLDGQLDPASRAAMQARLARDPVASATLQAWQQQRDLLRGLHAPVLDEAVPPALLAAAAQAGRAHAEVRLWWRWGGMAARLMLAFGLGWWVHGQSRSASTLAAAPPARDFIHQAAWAHAVYTPEVRHPVEVGSGEEEHLVQWLSKRLGRPLKLPQLQAQGYELVGGRLLPGSDGARAQFMYQSAQGVRVTIYLGTTPETVGDGQGTEFRYSTEGPVPSFYWVDDGFAYALSGALTRAELLLLARQVHQQL